MTNHKRSHDQLDQLLTDAIEGLAPGTVKRFWDGVSKDAKDARDYDGEAGLAGMESTLGISPSGNEAARVEAAGAEIARKIAQWEQTSAQKLLLDHASFGAIFRVIDRADVYVFLHSHDNLAAPGDKGLSWPDCWWGHLAAYLDNHNLWSRLWDQIHRETEAMMAQPMLKEVQHVSAVHAANASHAKHYTDRQRARAWYGEHKNMSKDAAAQKIIDERIVTASFRTVRRYLIDQ